MTQKLSSGVIVGGIAAVIVAVVFAACSSFRTHGNDAETQIVLVKQGQDCTVKADSTSKTTDPSVGKNKKITWHVTNNCGEAQTVLLGNFRKATTSTATTCTAATEGIDWPFKSGDETERQRSTVPAVPANGGTGDITLKEAKNDTSSKQPYYYDICVGGAKKDPRLVIDPY